MADKRRSLVDGLNETPNPRAARQEEHEFVYGRKADANAAAHSPSIKTHTPKEEPKPRGTKKPVNSSLREAMENSTHAGGRVTIGIKLHPVVDEALKRLSLTRKLRKVKPHSIQEIADQAIIEYLEKQPDIEDTL